MKDIARVVYSLLLDYLFPDGPDGMLRVFCKLNLPAGSVSPD